MVFNEVYEDEREDIGGESVDWTERVAIAFEQSNREVKTVYL